MYAGTTTQNTGGGYIPKTGLTSFQFLGVNPTQQQIADWTGRENVAEPNYDLTENLSNHMVRPIHLWLHSPEAGVTSRIIINIGSESAIAKSGNYQVCTTTGSVVWAKKDGQVKPEFADHKPLCIGEADLISFIQKLTNFNQKSGENFYQQMVEFKQDAQSLYNASYTGLNALAQWAKANGKQIVMPLTVQEKEVVKEDGTTVVKNYQIINQDSKTWYHGLTVDPWMINSLKKNYEASLVVGVGQTQAYPIVKNLFTYELQDFKKEDCVNAIPDNPSGNSGWN